MRALAFWKTIAVDEANLLESFLGLLAAHGIRYCVIGGQAVNAYAEPVVSLDLDVVIAAEDVARVEAAFRPVASIADVIEGKIWAATDAARRASKRQKDLADIARLLEVHPELRARVPAEVLARLV